MELEPRDADALVFCGWAKCLNDNWDGVWDKLDLAVGLMPSDSFALEIRGYAESAIMDHWGGLKYLDRAVRMAPNSWRAVGYRGCVKLVMGWNDQAERDLRAALRICEVNDPQNCDTAEVLHNLAWLLHGGRGKLDEAEALYRRALAIRLGPKHPDTAVSLNWLGDVLRERGRRAEAKKLYARAAGIAKAALGKNHPTTISCKAGLASVGVISCVKRALDR